MHALMDEMIERQEKLLLAMGRSIVPGITSDDLLQPNDFFELENHPSFRYEEGVLHGLRAAKIALLCYDRGNSVSFGCH